MKKFRFSKNGTAAIGQIVLMVVGIVAIAYMVGAQFTVVSAASGGNCLQTSDGQIWQESSNMMIPISSDGTQGTGWTKSSFCASPSKYAPYCINGDQINTNKFKIVKCPSTSSLNKLVSTITTPVAASVIKPGQYLSNLKITAPSLSQTNLASQVGKQITVDGTKYTVTKQGSSYMLKNSAGKVINPDTLYTKPSFLSRIWNWKVSGTNFGTQAILSNLAVAAAIYTGFRIVLGIAKVDPLLARRISEGAGLGYFAGRSIAELGLNAWASAGIGLFVMVGYTLLTYHETKQISVTFTCLPWDAQTGGKNCALCNKQDFPCTEYQCRSLGQGCQLLNQGEPGKELCVWVNQGDVTPPVINTWKDVLTSGYTYVPLTTSQGDNGVKIVPTGNPNGCIKAFTPLEFGIKLNEPGKCKISTNRTDSFASMPETYMGGDSASLYNHSQTMSLPSSNALASDNITLQNGGNFMLYIRCQDANGNANLKNYVVNFCVDKGPDTTPPLIMDTSIINGAPIRFNQTSTNLTVYTNEPSTCKWSRNDQSYDNMGNQMSCSNDVLQMNTNNEYACNTVLTGLKDRTNNTYYFRCEDQPWLAGTANASQRNVNSQSYVFSLMGTQPLVLNSVTPNGTTVTDSTDTVKVTLDAVTSAGYDNGNATCKYSQTGDAGSYISFYNTGSYNSTQDLYLAAGSYTYYVQCADLGGNTVTSKINFNVVTDTTPPVVVGAYHESNSLALVTDENATCVYGTTDCNYDFTDGIKFTETSAKGGTIHTTDWVPDQTLYVKCQDKFGNQPAPNECSIEVRPAQPQSQSS